MFGAGLTGEYLNVARIAGLDRAAVAALAANDIRASFLTDRPRPRSCPSWTRQPARPEPAGERPGHRRARTCRRCGRGPAYTPGWGAVGSLIGRLPMGVPHHWDVAVRPGEPEPDADRSAGERVHRRPGRGQPVLVRIASRGGMRRRPAATRESSWRRSSTTCIASRAPAREGTAAHGCGLVRREVGILDATTYRAPDPTPGWHPLPSPS
jgi:hypothetical protein